MSINKNYKCLSFFSLAILILHILVNGRQSLDLVVSFLQTNPCIIFLLFLTVQYGVYGPYCKYLSTASIIFTSWTKKVVIIATFAHTIH